MPAPITAAPSAAIASVPAGTASRASEADPVSFDSLLAAALSEAVPGEPAAVAVLTTGPAPSEDEAGDSAQVAEVLPEAPELDLTGAPLQVAMQTAFTPPPAAAPAVDALVVDAPVVDALAPARPGAGRADGDIPMQVRSEPALARSAPESALELLAPARIAAPAAASAPQANAGLAPVQPAAQLAAAEPAAAPDPAPLLGASAADTAASPAPLAAERLDHGTRTPAQPARLDIPAPLGSREFGTEVGSRLVWMATHNTQAAELRIDPPQLGPVEVRLIIANDQASLSIASPHAAVREAIQASLPRLQDMLQGLGISLENVSVGAEGFGQGHFDHPGLARDRGESGQGSSGLGYLVPQAAGEGAILALRPTIGVIDVYA